MWVIHEFRVKHVEGEMRNNVYWWHEDGREQCSYMHYTTEREAVHEMLAMCLSSASHFALQLKGLDECDKLNIS